MTFCNLSFNRMSPLAQTLLATWTVVLSTMIALWLLSLARRNASIVDPFWGCGFVIVAWTAFGLNPREPPRTLLLTALTTIWDCGCHCSCCGGIGDTARIVAIARCANITEPAFGG